MTFAKHTTKHAEHEAHQEPAPMPSGLVDHDPTNPPVVHDDPFVVHEADAPKGVMAPTTSHANQIDNANPPEGAPKWESQKFMLDEIDRHVRTTHGDYASTQLLKEIAAYLRGVARPT